MKAPYRNPVEAQATHCIVSDVLRTCIPYAELSVVIVAKTKRGIALQQASMCLTDLNIRDSCDG